VQKVIGCHFFAGSTAERWRNPRRAIGQKWVRGSTAGFKVLELVPLGGQPFILLIVACGVCMPQLKALSRILNIFQKRVGFGELQEEVLFGNNILCKKAVTLLLGARRKDGET